MHRLLILPLFLAGCSAAPDNIAENAAVPTLNELSEAPGDWSGLDRMVGRLPSESGLIESSPISVDLNATLGPAAGAFRDAMMRSGRLERRGALLVASGPDAWLVLQPGEHAFRAGLKQGDGWKEWQTPGSVVPRPAA
jgi:hypothetical protein